MNKTYAIYMFFVSLFFLIDKLAAFNLETVNTFYIVQAIFWFVVMVYGFIKLKRKKQVNVLF